MVAFLLHLPASSSSESELSKEGGWGKNRLVRAGESEGSLFPRPLSIL